METLNELETKLKELQAQCNQDWYSLGVKTYALNELPEEIEKLQLTLRNKNLEAAKLKEKLERFKATPKLEAVQTPEVTQ